MWYESDFALQTLTATVSDPPEDAIPLKPVVTKATALSLRLIHHFHSGFIGVIGRLVGVIGLTGVIGAYRVYMVYS